MEKSTHIEDYFLGGYNTLSNFSAIFGELTKFSEYATLITQDNRYHIIVLDNSAYAIAEKQQANGGYIFQNILKIEKSFIKRPSFKYGGEATYVDFETNVAVQIKYYDYSSEKKLIINQYNKIDLLYSIHITPDAQDVFNQLEIKTYVSLEQAIKRSKVMAELDKRVEEMMAKKNIPSLKNSS